ncbi:hypothetical protein HNP48_001658 [Acidovorax soli]|uniref:Uncharacterized protein n=1 Tax=Acidovorax soli TaxID=592050 RepID=A0A7X0PCB5_9BURK|nr:hypothetical protein [Acidovorax soli]MBB6558994.1 hypothetical protein [Acidovorax soli]
MSTTRRSILATLGALPCGLLQAQPQAVAQGPRAGIHPWLEVGDAVVADVLANGKVAAQLNHQATQPGLLRRPALVWALPKGLQRVQLRGNLTRAGKTTPFNKTWTVRDMASVSAPLYDQGKPWIERVRGLAKRLEEGTVTVERAKLPAGKPPAATALPQLEKRLGAPLPAMVRLLADWRVEVGDSSFVHPSAMTTVTDMLRRQWDYALSGKDGLDQLLSPSVRARYDRSLAVFVHVGDGMGALAWDPAGVTAGEPTHTWGDQGNPGAQPGTANEGVWYWLHQEYLRKPSLLLDEDYRPRNAEAAFTHVLQRLAFSEVEEAANDKELVVDSALPRANLLQLHFDEESRQPSLWLRSYDSYYTLF